MKSKFTSTLIGKIIGIVFIAISYFLFQSISFSNDNLFLVIMTCWLSYFIAFFGLGFLFQIILEKYKIPSFIYNRILSLPVFGFIYFQYLVAPILTIIMFLGIYFVPPYWVLMLAEKSLFIAQYSQGIIYILILLTVLFFAYKSYLVMRFILESFGTKLLRKHLEKYTNINFTRLYTYLLMIFIYIIYNFLTFSNITLNFIPFEMLNVIKEVFVTFVAIDTLIQIFISKNKEKGS